MAGVYIPGMEMPDYGYVCLKVFSNGDVVMTKEKRGSLVITGINEHIGRATSVPDHGRLIEEDAAYDKIAEEAGEEAGNYVDMDVVGKGLENTPTIIPEDKNGGQDNV